jgi:hypothetical protein
MPFPRFTQIVHRSPFLAEIRPAMTFDFWQKRGQLLENQAESKSDPENKFHHQAVSA